MNKLIECSTDEFEKQLFLKVSRSLNNSVSEGLFPISSKDVFSLSFSKAEDSLEMWRGYGKKSGIAISFERDKFLHDLPGMALIKNEQYEELLKNMMETPKRYVLSMNNRYSCIM